MAALGLLAVASLFSLRYGLANTGWHTVYEALVRPTDATTHLVIRTARLPRVVIATVVGISLGIAGTLTQALTRNPLASPGIFGINAGAAFFVVLGISFLGVDSMAVLMILALLGAAGSGAVVYVLGSLGRGGLSLLQVTLAGAAMAALFFSLTQGIIATNEAVRNEALLWMAGSVARPGLAALRPVLPLLVLG